MAITIKERQELRQKLMVELYEYYFQNTGNVYRTTRDELATDKEVDLAYQYLNSKSFIQVERQGNQIFLIKPTALGIDYVETKLAHKVSEQSNDSREPEQENSAQAFMEW